MTKIQTYHHAYRPRGDFAVALLKALGLEGQMVKRIVLTFDAAEPARMDVYLLQTEEKQDHLLTLLGNHTDEWIKGVPTDETESPPEEAPEDLG